MPRPITDTLRHLGGGTFLEAASEAMADAVTSATETGKAVKVTFEFTIKRASRTAGTVVISEKIVVKKPPEEPIETMLFATPDGNLLVEDPRQHKLPLKDISQPSVEFKNPAALAG